MRQICRTFIFFYFLFIASCLLFSQNRNGSSNLLQKAQINAKLISGNPEKSFIEANKIYDESIRLNNHEAELCALMNICRYYEKKHDLKNMLETAELLVRKSEIYNLSIYNAIARDYLSRVYSYNRLYKKAFEQLTLGLKIIESKNTDDSLVIDTRSNLYISFSNYYLMQNDNFNRLKYINLSIKEHNKNKNSDYLKKLHCIDFGNLATVYLEINQDSAEFYAKKSIALERYCDLKDVAFSNLIVLGKVNQNRGKFLESLLYYKQAEQMKDYKNHLNIEEIYDNMSDLFKEMNDSTSLKQYIDKLEKLKLEVSESKNESLSKIIEEMEKNDKKGDSSLLIIIIVIAIIIIVSLMILLMHRKNMMANHEKLSQKYFEEQLKDQREQVYSNLVEMVKNNDIAFFTAFLEIFPDFSKKLQAINPKIVQSEIEFCALLKLNITTKDIARYKYLEPRTVQNKKYLIRKKLNIPTNQDIYYWFSTI